MKITSKLIPLAIGALSIVFTVIPAMQSSAIGGTSGNAVCSRVENLYGTSRSTISAHVATMKSDFSTRLLRLNSAKATIDQRVLDARNSASIKLDAKLSELREKNGLTQEQLTGINKYEADVRAAEAVRVKAVDEARTTYRANLMEAVQTRQTEITTEVEAYQTAVNGALTAAKEACASDNSAISSLRATVKTARTTLASAQKSSKVNENIKAHAQARTGAINTANDTFKEAVRAYTETLAKILEPTD